MGKSKRVAEEAAVSSDAEPEVPKTKKTKKEDVEVTEESLSALAQPLAGKKTSKHVFKLVKKASKTRHLKRGVKEVVKSLRKNEKGIIVLAADISPVDILSHLPILAEEANCPYIWVNSKESLGSASSTKRPTSCVMVSQTTLKSGDKKDKEGAKEAESEFQEMFKEVQSEVQALE